MKVIAETLGAILALLFIFEILSIIPYIKDTLYYKIKLLIDDCKHRNIDTRHWLKKLIDKKRNIKS